MSELSTCRACGRPFNARFVKCPFCNTPSAPAATAFDYPAAAQQVIDSHRPFLLLEFHPASVVAVDAFFEQTWGTDGLAPNDDAWTPSKGQQAAIFGFGVFFGELLRREFGGVWCPNPGQAPNPFLAHVLLAGHLKASTINRSFLRLRQGSAEAFWPMYEAVRAQLKATAPPGPLDGWLRQAERFEQLGRGDVAAKLYAGALPLATDARFKAKLEAQRQKALASVEPKALEQPPPAAAPKAPVAAPAAVSRPPPADPLVEARALRLAGAERAKTVLTRKAFRVDRGAMTLHGLDVVLNEMFGTDPNPEPFRGFDAQVEAGVGAFVGDIFCGRFRAQWVEQPGAPFTSWKVAWPSGASVSPFALVRSRLEKGWKTPLLGLVAGVLKPLIAAGETTDPPEIAAEWIEQAQALATAGNRIDLALQFGVLAVGFGLDTPPVHQQLNEWRRRLGKPEVPAK
jgi:hypothetical protein